jgi:hypothetical protein
VDDDGTPTAVYTAIGAGVLDASIGLAAAHHRRPLALLLVIESVGSRALR